MYKASQTITIVNHRIHCLLAYADEARLETDRSADGHDSGLRLHQDNNLFRVALLSVRSNDTHHCMLAGKNEKRSIERWIAVELSERANQETDNNKSKGSVI